MTGQFGPHEDRKSGERCVWRPLVGQEQGCEAHRRSQAAGVTWPAARAARRSSSVRIVLASKLNAAAAGAWPISGKTDFASGGPPMRGTCGSAPDALSFITMMTRIVGIS